MNRHVDLSSRAPKNYAEESSRSAPDFRLLNHTGATQLGMLHATIGNRAVGQLVQRTFASTGTSIQRMTEEDKEGKANKEPLKKSRDKYNNLVKQFPKDKIIEDFDFLFGKAESYEKLSELIEVEFTKAHNRTKAVEAQKNKNKEEKEREALVPQSPSEPINSPTTTKVGSTKKKPQKVDITKDVISSPTTKQEAVSISTKATNVDLQTWIISQPVNASIEYTGMDVKEDTVYIYSTVKIAYKDPESGINYINEYPIEVHYHPVNKNKNLLHVKHSAGSSSKNQIAGNSWLIPGGVSTLKSAVETWNSTYPGYQSTHNW